MSAQARLGRKDVSVRRWMTVLAACAVLSASFGTRGVAGSLRGAPAVAIAKAGSGGLVIAAAGDIACNAWQGMKPKECRYLDTSDLLLSDPIDAVLALGDEQYPWGAYRGFRRYYDPAWGRSFGKTFPVPGNHEYRNDPTNAAAGYFRYFGDRARGPDGLGYYSFNLPRGCDASYRLCWHVIALSSELCLAPYRCRAPTDSTPDPGQKQYLWLQDDLSRHPNASYPCTIAFFHHPLYFDDGNNGLVRPLWEQLYAAQADIVLNGHMHYYARWRQMDPNGRWDPGRGIREFIVGTGGESLFTVRERPANLVKAQGTAFGVLKLRLYPRAYRWRWVSAAGQPRAFKDTSAHPAACV